MFCSQCGKPLPDGARFCGYCGSPAAAPPAAGSQTGEPLPEGIRRAPDGSLVWLYTGKQAYTPMECRMTGESIVYRFSPKKKSGSALGGFLKSTAAFAADTVLINDDNYMLDPPFMDSLDVPADAKQIIFSRITQIKTLPQKDRICISTPESYYEFYVPPTTFGFVERYIRQRRAVSE